MTQALRLRGSLSCSERSPPRGNAVGQEVEDLPERPVPIAVQQQAGAFDGLIAFAELCEAKLRGGPVVLRTIETPPGYGGAHHIVPHRPYRDVQIRVCDASPRQGLAQQLQASEHVRAKRPAR